MPSGYKQLKGKEMGVPNRDKLAQIQCLERDTGGEEEGKRERRMESLVWQADRRAFRYRAQLQAKRVHLRSFVDVVLSRVAETILESPCLLGKSPDQAF